MAPAHFHDERHMKHKSWPAEDLESAPHCPVCAGSGRNLLYAGLTDRVFGLAPGEWMLYRCTGCHSAWLDPRPGRASIGRAYEDYVTHVADDDVSVLPTNALIRRLHAWINDYKNARYGLKRMPAAWGGRWVVALVPSIRAKADAQCRHLPRRPDKGRRLLDVGFGNGGFLKLAREMGWSAQGIDFDPKAVAVAREQGLDVRCASVDDLLQEDARYDVITISHVIEHVYDPIELLGTLYRLLEPGGYLWLETPNLESAGARRFGRDWMALDPPRHLLLFTSRSLRTSLEKAGFQNIHQRWHGLIPLTIYPASEAIARGDLAVDATISGMPRVSAMLAELGAMFRPARREFLTFTAHKLP
jgi:2-polyprenyl-3-methyl-5-hydroxy-6-metoxy-1,4-benzoquinol methylase